MNLIGIRLHGQNHQKAKIQYFIHDFLPLLQSKNGKNGNFRFLKKYSPPRKTKITAMISAHWRIIISKKIASAR